MRRSAKKIWSDGWRMISSIFLLGIAIVVFTAPNDIVHGGTSGLATALAEVVPLKLGTINLILSLITEGIGWWQFGLYFIVKSTLISIGLSAFLNTFQGMLPTYTSDPLVAAIAGGILIGLGSAVLLSNDISSGGVDTIGLTVKKYFPRVSVGKVIMTVNASVVVLGVIIFRNIDVAIYSAFTIMCCGKVVDSILLGRDHAKLLYIISEDVDQLRKFLIEQMHVGITQLHGKGGFTGEDRGILMVTVRKSRFSTVLKAVNKMDKNSFIIVQDVAEVWEAGFKKKA